MESFLEYLKDFDVKTVITIIGAVWFFNRKTLKETKEIKEEVKNVQVKLNVLESRFIRLEGRFDERGYWESRNYKPHEKGF